MGARSAATAPIPMNFARRRRRRIGRPPSRSRAPAARGPMRPTLSNLGALHTDWSISRKSGHGFSAGNATKYKQLERFSIQCNREALYTRIGRAGAPSFGPHGDLVKELVVA